MIVLWGLTADSPLSAVYRELCEIGAPTVLIDQRRILEYGFELKIDGDQVSGKINWPGGSLDLDQVKAIYLRQYDFSQLDLFAGIDRSSVEWRNAVQFEDAMLLWCEACDARVVNRPSSMGSNTSKPYQLELIRQGGFLVPETLITTDPESVIAFWNKHQLVIYKSISSRRSIVSRLTPEHLGRINDVICCPTQFQRCIEGIDYRVHVLGEKIFAARITSRGCDYRYSQDACVTSTVIPDEIAEKCLLLTKNLRLLFSGIDLRLAVNGEWYCFEVNPSPGFTYFQREAEIDKELAAFLAGS
jgi:hypothetical protein